jgi:aprataxin
MKTKKHYNSFRTDLGFFVHLSDVEEWIESDSRIVSGMSITAMPIADGSPFLAMKC